jgi:hypothetical protein
LTINGDIGDHHLHLTTGALNETSIILGTDEHNVRTTIDGKIQITTPTEGSNVWEFDTDGNLTFPGSSNGKIGESEPGLVVFSDSNFVVLANANTEDSKPWAFGADGTTTFPNDTIDAGTNDITIQSNDSVTLVYGALDGNWQAEPTQNQLAGLVASYDGIGITLVRGDDGEEGPQWNHEWLFNKDGDLTLPASGDIVDSTGVGQLANRVEGSWNVTAGTNTYSFTVPSDGTYTMWVKCNIPNGIIVWNATASVSNSNVPAIGQQYAWNYTGGGSPILLTAIPNQIRGTAGTISTDATYAGTTSNRFDFTIANTSGETQTVYYGYTKV